MLTIFSLPKAFRDEFAVIQRNAIRSWTFLNPELEILLFGDEDGTEAVAEELELRFVPEIARNEYGTPLVDDFFRKAQELARYPVVCYVNADIILLSDFPSAVRRIPFPNFLMVGRRWDLDLSAQIDFAEGNWEANLRLRLQTAGTIHDPSGIDYFVFPRGLYRSLPSFALGRTVWDNWLVYQAHANSARVIDATEAVTAVHQNHSYHHAGGTEEARKGVEAKRNLELAGGRDRLFTILDADCQLTADGLKVPKWTKDQMNRRLDVLAICRPRLRLLVRFLKKIVRLWWMLKAT